MQPYFPSFSDVTRPSTKPGSSSRPSNAGEFGAQQYSPFDVLANATRAPAQPVKQSRTARNFAARSYNPVKNVKAKHSSCGPCRAKKSKCDRRTFCSSCRMRGDRCYWEGGATPSNPDETAAPATGGVPPLAASLGPMTEEMSVAAELEHLKRIVSALCMRLGVDPSNPWGIPPQFSPAAQSAPRFGAMPGMPPQGMFFGANAMGTPMPQHQQQQQPQPPPANLATPAMMQQQMMAQMQFQAKMQAEMEAAQAHAQAQAQHQHHHQNGRSREESFNEPTTVDRSNSSRSGSPSSAGSSHPDENPSNVDATMGGASPHDQQAPSLSIVTTPGDAENHSGKQFDTSTSATFGPQSAELMNWYEKATEAQKSLWAGPNSAGGGGPQMPTSAGEMLSGMWQ